MCNSGRKNKAAIIWEGEPGDERVLTYRDVWREVNKFANVLKKLGVKKGDRVCLYMGMVPELVDRHARLQPHRRAAQRGIRRLQRRSACATASTMLKPKCSSPPTAATGAARWCRLKKNADEAHDRHAVDRAIVVVVKRVGADSGAQMKEGRDLWWDDADGRCAAMV